MEPSPESPKSTRLTYGSCICNSVTYKIQGEPQMTGVCHCDNCKKSAGSMCQWVLFFSKEQITIEKKSTLKTYEDYVTFRKTKLERQFCSNCGCPVFWVIEDRPEMILVAGGTIMNDPKAKPGNDIAKAKGVMQDWRPQYEFFCGTRTDWVGSFGETMRFEEMPDWTRIHAQAQGQVA